MLTMQASQPTDLWGRCMDGDRSAWRELHRTHFPTVYAFLRAMGVRPGDLDDACQEVFVLVFRHLDQFQGRSQFRTWLYRLCVTQAGRVRRRARMWARLQWLLGEKGGLDRHQPGPDWSEQQAIDRVQRALDRLSPKLRVVLVLRELEGLEVDEIAKIAGCPEATVWTRLHHARKKVEAALTEEAP